MCGVTKTIDCPFVISCTQISGNNSSETIKCLVVLLQKPKVSTSNCDVTLLPPRKQQIMKTAVIYYVKYCSQSFSRQNFWKPGGVFIFSRLLVILSGIMSKEQNCNYENILLLVAETFWEQVFVTAFASAVIGKSGILG